MEFNWSKKRRGKKERVERERGRNLMNEALSALSRVYKPNHMIRGLKIRQHIKTLANLSKTGRPPDTTGQPK